MVRIYRTTDRIKVKVDSIVVTIAPLSVDEKAEISQFMLAGKLRDFKAAAKGTALTVKYAVKDVSGIVDQKNQPYKVAFDENGYLTDQCVSELFNLEMSGKLTEICMSLVEKIPDVFTDAKGKKLEGVEILKTEDDDSKNSPA